MALGWLPLNVDPLSNPITSSLRLTDVGQVIGIAALCVGALLLTLMWLSVEHEVHTPWQLTRFALSASLPSLLTPPIFSRDVYSYVAQGQLQVAGFNPYEVGIEKLPNWFVFGTDPMWAQTTTPYGAAYLLIEKFSVWITTDIYQSMVVLRAINILAFVVSIYGLNRLAKAHSISANFAIWLAVLNPITILHLINAVHNDSVMIAGLIWAFVFAHEKRLFFACITLTFAIAIKPIAIIALPFLAISYNPKSDTYTRFKDWARSGTFVFIGLYGLGAVTNTGFGWINSLATPAAVINLAAPITLVGELLSGITGWLGFDAGDQITLIMRITGLALCAAFIVKQSFSLKEVSGTRRAALALTCMILLSPVVFPWYFLWPLALFAGSGLQTIRGMKFAVYLTLLVVSYSIIEAIFVRDSAITLGEVAFAFLVMAGIFSLMKFKENQEIFDLEQVRVN